ncbi:MAG TPA: ChbG/HpnK family deacetylase [Gemmatimonadaceae bacterium]|nr:ChbG/HpnK family deacetylase [Gemmatimonadaceae bacterium]
MGNRKLVVNADDLGLAESVNRGIAETIEMGVVTSTSLMVNTPACDDAIRRLRYLRALGKSVSVGLHFNIVMGPPLSECSSLVDDRTGEFLPLHSLIWRSVARKVNLEDVKLELDAQLERAKHLLAKINMRVTHIDSHRHAHVLPGIFELVLRTAKEHGITHVRHPYESRPMPRSTRAVVASRLLRTILYKQRPMDDVSFAGIGAMASPTFHRDISQMLGDLPAGVTELMVHPGYDSAELAALDDYRASREREVYALISPRLRERIQELGVELTHFGVAPTTPSTAQPA